MSIIEYDKAIDALTVLYAVASVKSKTPSSTQLCLAIDKAKEELVTYIKEQTANKKGDDAW